MERATFSNMDCPIARAAEEVGEGWTLLVLREAFKGALTFSDFESRLPIAPNTLTRRLDVLCSRGLLERATYQTNPPRDQYVLTEKALDLLPVLIALGEWGNRWLAPEGELLTVIDAQSGRAMDVAVVDRRTSRPLRAGSVAIKAGPGARRPVREALKTAMVLGAGTQPAGKTRQTRSNDHGQVGRKSGSHHRRH
jgi:DNA-binding HxlR family transcriptional regulator